MARFLPIFLLATSAFWLGLSSARAALPEPLMTFFQHNCYECHDSAVTRGGLDLSQLSPDLADPVNLALWVRIHDRVQYGEMPPPNEFVVPYEERAPFLAAIAPVIHHADEQVKGTVKRRLNRKQYENTLNDLLGTRVSLAELLPEDGKGFVFDNIGDFLDLSSVHLERMIDAAGLAIDAAVRRTQPVSAQVQTVRIADPASPNSREHDMVGRFALRRDSDQAFVIFDESALFVRDFNLIMPGFYRVKMRVEPYQTDEHLAFRLIGVYRDFEGGHQTLGEFNVEPGRVNEIETVVQVRSGGRFQVQPINLRLNRPLLRELDGDITRYDQAGLAFVDFEIEGPLVDGWPGRGHELLFGDLAPANPPASFRGVSRQTQPIISADPEADIRRLLPPFVEAAFRRPPTRQEVDRYINLALAQLQNGASFEDAIRTAHLAVLVSPGFLFFNEPEHGPLDDYALASRLSYFLWKSLPDTELLQLASAGRLRDPVVLRQQTDRLLADPRSERFVDDFATQWLDLHMIDDTTPDRRLYPEFDDTLQTAMVKESMLFFDTVLRENLSVLNFIHSDWTYANARLAKHYRLANADSVRGFNMQRVSLTPEDRRGGVMTQASVLKVTANGANTSPILRGIWVLERLLGYHPPPPPPNVPGLEPDIRGAETIKEILSQHRDNPSCIGCHLVIDPPGFALESYDVIGGWRDNYRSLGEDFPVPPAELTNGGRVNWRVGPAVDPSGVTTGQMAFEDVTGFKQILLQYPDKIAGAFTGKLAAYATGREMRFSDRPILQSIVAAAAPEQYRIQDLIHGVVQSPIFLNK